MEFKKNIEWINQGITLMQAEKYEEAKEYFKKAVENDNTNDEVYIHLSNACVAMEQFEEAQDALFKALEINPDNSISHFYLGNIYLLKNNLPKCIEHYNIADKKRFDGIELYINLFTVYMQVGDTAQALRNINKAIKIEPLMAELRIEKAKLYIMLNKFDEALTTLDDLEKLVPDAFEIYDLKTQIYCAQKQYDSALETVRYAVDKFENDVVLRWLKIRVLVEMQKNDEAKAEIEIIKQQELYPTVARQVAIQESTLYVNEKDSTKAVKALEDALKYDDDFSDEIYSYILMNLYISIKDYSKAKEQAIKLETLETNSVFCISGMFYNAYLAKMMGDLEAANERFKELCSIFRKITLEKMNFYEAYMYRALCHKEIEEYDKAMELADYIENLHPERADAYAIKYGIYSAMGQVADAEEQKKKALEINPDLNL